MKIPVALLFLAATLPVSGRAEESYAEPEISERDRRHWSFQPVRRAEIPKIERANHPIDAFVLARLRQNEIDALAPRAEPETLLRRLTFDLTGLPPTPKQRRRFLDAWETDPDQAISFAADALLASPHYGERWAQHWLDVARFAETDGFEHDKIRENAWQYRDWVVRALNADLPYDRFLAWQIAGDELVPEDPDARLATGFLLAGPDMPDINLESERRHNVLNELTGSVGAAFLGLTMECAQCHDHKSDPISQADFYRLRAFFENLEMPKKNKSLPHRFSEIGDREMPSHLMIRGDFRRPGAALEPAFLRVLPEGENTPEVSPIGNSSGRRSALARRLIDPSHPLTARVIVNRVWQHHFGTPLVGTPSDFGKLGDRPTHPELLDWLASELIRRDWSLKSLHRLILTSQTWQQASTGSGEDWKARLRKDPDNRLLSCQNRQRLSGEAIRDAMLLTSGRLNPKAGGPGVRPPLPPEVTVTLLKNQWPVTEDVSEHDRRSLYLFARRNLRYPMFGLFDRPDGNQSCARRHVSTTAPQSLTLLNDPFVHGIAESLADRVAVLSGDGDSADSITAAFLLTLGREPDDLEWKLGKKYLATRTLKDYCLVLLNLSEFVYID